MSPRDAVRVLQQSGYVHIPKWYPDSTTIYVASSLGKVVDIGALLPRSSIPTVQVLQPIQKNESSTNRYSGTYGLSEFPLHTDLAHWALPPRYLMLRCRSRAHSTVTHVLHNSVIESKLGMATLRRAIARPRRAGPNGALSLLSLMFRSGGTWGVRWDSLFLVPMNAAADQFAEVMKTRSWDQSRLMLLTLAEPGDTLVLDNWRYLHGRSRVSVTGIDRRLERIYLSEMNT